MNANLPKSHHKSTHKFIMIILSKFPDEEGYMMKGKTS